MRQDLDRLQGTWNIVSMEMDGRKTTGGSARIVVRGDRFSTIGMGATYDGTLLVHQTTAPKSFDLRFEEGPEKGNTSLGIYQLDGDTWKICLTTRGSERPQEFAAPPGTGIALETLQRAAAVDVQAAPLAPAASVGPEGDPAPELAGVWTPLSLVRDGQVLPQSMLQYGRRIATANEVTVRFGPDVVLHARYAVDRSCTPMTMDYLLAGGQAQHGIWALKGKRLTTCFGAPGEARPTAFASTPGDGRTLTVWTPCAGTKNSQGLR
jgi:uncharacterized protein (TIGR03067 family)